MHVQSYIDYASLEHGFIKISHTCSKCKIIIRGSLIYNSIIYNALVHNSIANKQHY